jgi:hypothetical protein
MSKRLSSVIFIGILCGLGITVFFSQEISAGILKGISISLSSLIPSLYFFMVLSNFILNTKLRYIISRPFRIIAKHVFHLDDTLFSIFLLSILGGYPIGAKLIADQIKQNSISPQVGEYMLNFCINCSPAFLISYLSVTLWDSIEIGLILYLSQIASCVIIAFITGRKKPIYYSSQIKSEVCSSKSIALVQSVNQATKTMVTISSFVIVFCGIFPIVQQLLPNGLTEFILNGLAEVTSGCQRLATIPAYPAVLLASAFTSFGGICVIFQITALLSGCQIRFMRWVCFRIVYTLLSVFFTYLGLQWFHPALPTMSQFNTAKIEFFTASPAAFAGMLLLASMLLLISFSSQTIHLPNISLLKHRRH